MSVQFVGYIIRSVISLAFLYLFFVIFLGREKTYRFNRFYLIASLVFSFVVPLITFPEFIKTPITGSLALPDFQGDYYIIKSSESQLEKQFILQSLIPYLYLSVTCLLCVRFVYNLIKLKITGTAYPSVDFEGYRVVLIEKLTLPFSFLSTIYVNSADYKEGRIPDELFSHEISHIVQRHSLDILFIELLKVFFWFNPILFLFKRAITLNHEYLADEEVTRSKHNSDSYIHILLTIAFRDKKTCLASSFHYSFTKKRLLMMTKNNCSKTALFKKIAVIPLFLSLGLLVINAQDTKPVKSKDLTPAQQITDTGDMWWIPILNKHNVKMTAYNNFKNIFEMGENNSIDNDGVCTLTNAFMIIIDSVENYMIIESPQIIHDLKNEIIKADSGTIKKFRKDSDPDEPYEVYQIVRMELHSKKN